MTKYQRPTTDFAERLVAVLASPRPDCLLWPYSTTSGYGTVEHEGRTRRVHRLIWQFTKGPIPDGMTIDHLCRVRACCNTDHMELVTREENIKRARGYPKLPRSDIGKPRKRMTICQRGHEMTPENTYKRPDGRGGSCLTCRLASLARANERRRKTPKPD